MTTTENKTGKNGGSSIAPYIFAVVLLLILAEGIASIILYQQKGPEKLASLETLRNVKGMFVKNEFPINYNNQNLVRPDSSKEANKIIADEAMQSNRFVQQSWVEFRNMDFNGKYMHMNGPLRRTIPDVFYNPKSNDTLDIYFFGGSTQFGFNVTDEETIPSQFVKLYKEKFPEGKSIRVYNYGTPTYYSYQELVLLSDLIYSGHRPGIAVFLDGINDFWFATSAYYRQSYFSYVFRQVFDRGLDSDNKMQFVDTADNMFKDPKNIPLQQYNDKLVSNYFENMENIRKMCALSGTRPYFFSQPSPFYNYGNQQSDPICFKDTNTRFNYIYPLVEQRGKEYKDFIFLGNMLEHEKGYPFVDGLHYSPAFIKKITSRMLDEVIK